MKDELRALAERVMALTEPCRETDALVALSIGYECPRTLQTVSQMQSWSPQNTIEEIARWADYSTTAFLLPHFTASLDAAMTLKLPGYRMTIYTGDEQQKPTATAMSPQGEWKGQGVSLILPAAVAAAWLLALAEQVEP